MTEHNLPEKDDAPWLNCMDGLKMTEKEYKPFEEHTREELIDLALEEVDWLVIGGQDGEEFYNSIQFIRKVLRSLK